MLRQFDSVSGRLLLIGVCFTEFIFFICVQQISFAYLNLLLMAISYVDIYCFLSVICNCFACSLRSSHIYLHRCLRPILGHAISYM